MILSFLFLFLILLLISALFLFIFNILIPAMNQQTLYVGEPFFADDELAVPQLFAPHEKLKSSTKAFVQCSGCKQFETEPIVFSGIRDCRIFSVLYGSPNDCPRSCCGFGSCAAVCVRNAIRIVNNTAVVTDDCNGCGKCVAVCPMKLIKILPCVHGGAAHLKCAAGSEIQTTCSCFGQPVAAGPVDSGNAVAHALGSFIQKLAGRKSDPGQEIQDD